jgi:hypothetical protein
MRSPQNRRRNVGKAHGLRSLFGLLPRRRNDQRHAKRRVVEQHAVRPLAVIAESLAMVAGHHDDRPALERDRVQPLQHSGHLRIGVGDLGVVAGSRVDGDARRRIVGRVGIVEVEPDEEWSLVLGAWSLVRPRSLVRPSSLVPYLQPRGRAIDDDRRWPFGLEAFGGVRIAWDLIVVGVESAREAEAAIEHERADERGGAVAGRFEQRGDGWMGRVGLIDAVFADAVLRWKQAGQDRRVRRQRQRHSASSGGESDR